MESFIEAIRYFNLRQIYTMISYISRTPRAEGQCEALFNKIKGHVNPLSDRNRQMRILIAMANVNARYLLR